MAQLGKLSSAIVLVSGLLVSIGPATRVHAEPRPEPRAPNAPAPNPFLASAKFAIARIDPAGTGSFPYAVPRGSFHVDLQRAPRIVQGPLNPMTYASTSPDFMWAQSTQGVVYVDVAKGGLRELARAAAPGAKVISPDLHRKVLGQRYVDMPQIVGMVKEGYALDGTRLGNGVHSLVDRENRFYYGSSSTRTISIFALRDPTDPAAGIRLIRTADFSPSLRPQETLQGLSMTYDGKLLVLCTSSLWIIDRALKDRPQVIRFGGHERIRSGVVVDEFNGIYFASDKLMRKVVWTGSRLSQNEVDGAWTSTYDGGPTSPASPALMGFGDDPDKLVVIVGGSQRTKLLAFWRDRIPAGFERRAGQIETGSKSQLATVVSGYGVVAASLPAQREDDKLVDLLAIGPIHEPPRGVERFAWDPATDSWRSIWRRGDVVSTGATPTVSTTSNIVFVGGYSKREGWEVTGLDWNSGRTVHRTIFGQNALGNGVAALIQFLPDGDLLFNGIGGQSRVKLGKPR